ncbi:MAG: hypothetical protein ACLUOF_02225 [Ruminococcus sp.]
MKRKTAQRNGSAILWAVLVMLMISLISAGIILVDRMYFMREQERKQSSPGEVLCESAIELVQSDICKEGTALTDGTDGTYTSMYVSAGNTAETFTISFPDAANWTCTVTVNHSVVNDSESDVNKKRLSGDLPHRKGDTQYQRRRRKRAFRGLCKAGGEKQHLAADRLLSSVRRWAYAKTT